MVDKLKKIIKKIEAQKGVITLFMLWKDAQDIEKWSIVISALWMNKMNQRVALDFWIKNIQSTLNTSELREISRISIIKTNDNFVQYLTRVLNISGGSSRFSKSQIGNYYINDAIIFEAKGSITPNAPIGSVNRNPAINGAINPNINSMINPNFNSMINPNFNSMINPNFNSIINPNFNSMINPNFNSMINPNFNSMINPNFNSMINPNFNSMINPLLNFNFSGLVLYDLTLKKTAYFIEANNNILLMFDFGNNFAGFCVKAKLNFYNVFDVKNNWIGYLASNKRKGFNYFTINAAWIGFVI